MMTTTWLIFTYQENWMLHPLQLVALMLHTGFMGLQIQVQNDTNQAEQVEQQFKGRMMLRSSKCYLRLQNFSSLILPDTTGLVK